MAVTITSDPTASFTGPRPAGQKLVYTMYDATTPDRYIVEVFETDTVGATSGTALGKMYLTPNAAGRAHFDLTDIIEGRVSAPIHNQHGTIVHSVATIDYPETGEGAKRYVVKAGQYNAGTEIKAEDTDAIYLIGGAHQLSEGLNPDFSTYYALGSTYKFWLSDLVPDSKYISMYMADEDEAVGTFINTLFLLPTTLLNKVRVRLYNEAGTLVATLTNTVNSGVTVSQNYNLIPLGPKNMATYFGGLWTTSWGKYIIDPVQSDGTTQVGKGITVYRDCRPYKHEAVQLAWTNTVGGWDYLRFDGRNLKTINTEAKTYRKAVGTYDEATFTFDTFSRGTTAYHLTGKETWALRNRYFEAYERDLLQYAFRSKEVMYRVGSGEWLPCTIQTNTYTVQPAAAQLFDVAFNIELSQDIRC